jgi:SAM-dependent methyltransferase
LVQQTPIPRDTDVFYTSNYPMHQSRGVFYRLGRKVLIHGVYFKPRSSDRDCVLMDFGCGDGSYLESIEGQVEQRIGFEAFQEQAQQVARRLGLQVAWDPDDRKVVPDASIDIITAHFVLEHVVDLEGAFRYWKRVLKPGGRIHLSLPNIGSFEAGLFGMKWHGLDAPRHISFPAKGNLDRLAARHGFRVTKRAWGIFPNTWSASLATMLAGRYHHYLFLSLLPLGFILACLMPQGTAVTTLEFER